MIVDHYMTKHLDISRRVHDNYHRVENDDLLKNIINSGKNKEGARMKIPDWMLIEEMKQTNHYHIAMMDEELDQLLEGAENVDVDAFMDDVLNSQEDPETRVEPRSDKESLKEIKNLDKTGNELTTLTEDAPSSANKEKLYELMVIDHSPSASSSKPKTGRFRRYKSFIQEVHIIANTTILIYVAKGLLLDIQKTQADVAAMIAEAI
ncbi:hypothetical protein Tco_0053730 [Tanacetum coccineum]